jgi:hypothetical protein
VLFSIESSPCFSFLEDDFRDDFFLFFFLLLLLEE